MDNTFTYYDLLGVRPNASCAAIHDAYRAAMLQYHPDVNKAPNAQQIAALLNRAYEALRDPANRSRYDREIGARTGPTDAGSQEGPGPKKAQNQDSRRSTAPADPISSAVGRLVTRVVGGAVVVVVGLAVVGLLFHLLPFVLAAGLVFVIGRKVLRSIF